MNCKNWLRHVDYQLLQETDGGTNLVLILDFSGDGYGHLVYPHVLTCLYTWHYWNHSHYYGVSVLQRYVHSTRMHRWKTAIPTDTKVPETFAFIPGKVHTCVWTWTSACRKSLPICGELSCGTNTYKTFFIFYKEMWELTIIRVL